MARRKSSKKVPKKYHLASLRKRTKAELAKLASKEKIPGRAGLTKEELIELINDYGRGRSTGSSRSGGTRCVVEKDEILYKGNPSSLSKDALIARLLQLQEAGHQVFVTEKDKKCDLVQEIVRIEEVDPDDDEYWQTLSTEYIKGHISGKAGVLGTPRGRYHSAISRGKKASPFAKKSPTIRSVVRSISPRSAVSSRPASVIRSPAAIRASRLLSYGRPAVRACLIDVVDGNGDFIQVDTSVFSKDKLWAAAKRNRSVSYFLRQKNNTTICDIVEAIFAAEIDTEHPIWRQGFKPGNRRPPFYLKKSQRKTDSSAQRDVVSSGNSPRISKKKNRSRLSVRRRPRRTSSPRRRRRRSTTSSPKRRTSSPKRRTSSPRRRRRTSSPKRRPRRTRTRRRRARVSPAPLVVRKTPGGGKKK